jgi:hypothetical protein
MTCLFPRSPLQVLMGSESSVVRNVHGLNSRVRRDVVRELVAAKRPSIFLPTRN